MGRRCGWRRVVTAGIALIAVTTGGCTGGSATDADATPSTAPTPAGSATTTGTTGVRLPPTPHLHDASAGTYDVSVSVRAEGEDTTDVGPQRAHVRMNYRTSVVDVDTDSSYTTETKVRDLHLVSASKALQDVRPKLAALASFTMRQDYGADGEPQSRPEIVDEGELEPDQRDLLHHFVDEMAQTAASFADHRVAEGDTWDVERTYTENGIDLTVVTHYTLSKLTADSYTLTYQHDSDIDQSSDSDGQQTTVTGHIKGSGTIVGSRTNPVAVTVRAVERVQMDFSSDSGDMHMTMRFTFDSAVK